MYTLLPALLMAVGLLALAGCAADELTGLRQTPARPVFTTAGATHLLVMNALTYLPGSGVDVELGLNRGLLTAAQDGEADFRVTVRLTATDATGGTRFISPKGDPLAGLKVFLVDGGIEYVRMLVPWDGLLDDGTPAAGATRLDWVVEVANFRPNPTGDGIVLGSASGSATIVIE